jgi:hypothetical protein
MLENMQLEEEQGQEFNVGGEGQAAYLDRLRVLRASVAQHHQQIDRLTNYFAQEHERVNLFSNQLHLLPRAVVVTAGMQADVQEMQQSLRQENAEQRQQNAALRTQVDVYAEALRDLEEKHAVVAQENAVLRKQERKQAWVLKQVQRVLQRESTRAARSERREAATMKRLVAARTRVAGTLSSPPGSASFYFFYLLCPLSQAWLDGLCLPFLK